MERGCKTCGISITHKKSNAKYCSPKCKTNYWLYGDNYDKVKNAEKGEIRKGDFLVSRKSLETKIKVVTPLKGVIEDRLQNEASSPQEIDNPEYSRLRDIKLSIELLLRKAKNSLNEAKIQMNQLSVQSPILMSSGTGTILGGYAKKLSNKQSKSKFSLGGALLGGLLGTGVGFFLKKNNEKKVEHIQINIVPELNQRIAFLTKKLKRASSFMVKTPRLIANPNYSEPVKKKSTLTPLPESDINEASFISNEVETNEKIICSNDLMEMQFHSLDFKDDWHALIGKPSLNFKMAVFGKPGQGKSTFCLLFANYLAQNFGRVLYVSGEEGFSKTMKDKLQNNQAFGKNLYIADVNSAQDMIDSIPQNSYHFIVIDSLNNMGIDEHKLMEIEEHYNNCAMISIAQSTKKGEMRGSQEILHNVDIVLKVEDGLAECTKNRFAPLGFEFPIF